MDRNLINLFEQIQAIPYKIKLGENHLEETRASYYANCKQKRDLLIKTLKDHKYEPRVLDAVFDWKDLSLPREILETLKNSGTFQKHHLLEVKIEESYLKIDPTWDLEMKKFGFPVTINWDGKSDTKQITEGKIFFYNPQIESVSLPYFPEERKKFAEKFNDWLMRG